MITFNFDERAFEREMLKAVEDKFKDHVTTTLRRNGLSRLSVRFVTKNQKLAAEFSGEEEDVKKALALLSD